MKKLFWIGLLLNICYSCKQQKQESNAIDDRPNIVWIIAEDLSLDLHSYGNELVHTPNLDRLAATGIQYQNVYATGPACSPSRTAFVTGYYQTSIGAYHMRYPDSLKPALPSGVLPIQEVMKKAGYTTANIKDKNGNGKTDWLFQYPEKSYDVYQWDSIPKGTKYFARINFGETHRGFREDKSLPLDKEKIEIPPYYPNHEVSKKDWELYYETIQHLDRKVGRVIADLERLNLLENTLIFFFSDHGRPMPRAKNFLYDSGLRVPLMIASFDEKTKKKYLNKNEDIDALWSLIDVNATTLDLAGVKDYPSQGKILLGANKEKRKWVFAAQDRMGEVFFKSRTVKNKRFNYIRNFDQNNSINGGSTAYRKANHPIYHLLIELQKEGKLTKDQERLLSPMPKEELYDLEKDPFELNNLVENIEYQQNLEEMRSVLTTTLKEVNDQGLREDDEVIIEAFKNYGERSLRSHQKKIERLNQKVKETIEKTKGK